jgi:hypothetical protein
MKWNDMATENGEIAVDIATSVLDCHISRF